MVNLPWIGSVKGADDTKSSVSGFKALKEDTAKCQRYKKRFKKCIKPDGNIIFLLFSSFPYTDLIHYLLYFCLPLFFCLSSGVEASEDIQVTCFTNVMIYSPYLFFSIAFHHIVCVYAFFFIDKATFPPQSSVNSLLQYFNFSTPPFPCRVFQVQIENAWKQVDGKHTSSSSFHLAPQFHTTF